MGIYRFSSLHIVFMFLLLKSPHQCDAESRDSHDLVHQSCKKVAKSDPNFSYKFCVTNLEANPKSKSATSLDKLTLVSIELAISNATKIRSNISMLLKQKQFTRDPYAKDCLDDCLVFYSDAISSLRDAKRDFRSKSFAMANLEISSAMDAPSTCEDGFREKKSLVSPLTQENNAFFQWTVISIAFTNMIWHK